VELERPTCEHLVPRLSPSELVVDTYHSQTGTTDIPLTPKGEQMIKTLAPNIVGDGKLLDSKNIQHAFVSPRTRAQRTFQLLFEGSQLPKFSTEEGTYPDYSGRGSTER
jgi:broad specificity phosphatase PhoE